MSFHFKAFDEMTPEDYADIGFMCGLEVHQQLLTDRKLFCRCPAGRYSSEFDAEILRHMRPTLSELGEYDGTALMEKKTKKNIYYRIRSETVCTYEFDDTPPFFPDEKAIDIALELCMLTNLNLVNEIHIARKQYLDGSIPTGFQRTAILGVDGWLPYKDRKVGMRQLSIEEDSCREVSDIGHDRVYLTDRLGMPLIEVVTEPHMYTPTEVAEVCQLIRMVCRSTGKVRTGYGATREDVNVSVRGGTRVEIKGVPQITRIPLLVYNEAMRQCALLHIREMLKERGVTPDTFKWSSYDATRILTRTPYQPIREAVEQGHRVKAVVLRGFSGLLNHPTQEHTIFAKEFSDRVRVVSCLTSLPNIAHSDTASEQLSVRDWKDLRKRTKAGEKDALILVWGGEADTEMACSEIALRAKEATEGVPNDTRQAMKDGTNGFERVLPGAERMYPDTDLPPLEIIESRVERIRGRLPEVVWERQARYREMGLPADVIDPLCFPHRAGIFDRLVGELEIDPILASVVLVQRFKAFRREGLPVGTLTEDEILSVFKALAEGRLAREGVVAVFAAALSSKESSEADEDTSPIARALEVLSGHTVTDAALAERVAHAVEYADSSKFETPRKKYRVLMGGLMKELTGKAEGRQVAKVLAEAMGIPCEGCSPEEVQA